MEADDLLLCVVAHVCTCRCEAAQSQECPSCSRARQLSKKIKIRPIRKWLERLLKFEEFRNLLLRSEEWMQPTGRPAEAGS